MMIFLAGALIIAVSASAVTIKTLFGYVSLKPVYKWIGSIFIVWGWFSPAIVASVFKSGGWAQIAASGVIFFSFFLFGLVFLIFVFLMARDFVWFSTYSILKLFKRHNPKYHPKNPESYPLLNKTNAAMVLCALFVGFFSLYAGMKIPSIKKVELTTDKFAGEATFVQLSDLHLNRYYKTARLEKIVNRVNAQHPDAVFLTGDILDDDFAHIKQFLPVLQKIQAPQGVYMVWGNHEFYKRLPAAIYDLAAHGMVVLQNDGLRLPAKYPVFVAGINSPWHKNLPDAFKKSVSGEYRILLSHYPIAFDEAAEYVDLQLSGHTHGGQIFPFHFMSKRVNKYLAGIYKKDGAVLYVSRGAGLWGPPLRFLAPSEITRLTVRGTQSAD